MAYSKQVILCLVLLTHRTPAGLDAEEQVEEESEEDEEEDSHGSDDEEDDEEDEGDSNEGKEGEVEEGKFSGPAHSVNARTKK